MRRYNVFLMLVPLFFISLCPQIVRAQESIPLSSKLAVLDSYKAEIEEAYKNMPQSDSKTADLISQAFARIEATKKFLILNPKTKETRDLFTACELLTKLSIIQIKTVRNETRLLELQKQRESVYQELKSTLKQIKQTQEKISRIERGHVSKFREDLAKERRKAEEQWEEAKLRFSELESDLIQVRNEARRTIITVSDLLFGFDKHELTDALKISLARITGILSVFRDLSVMIEGHTDNKGTEEYNQKLSENRANNVLDFMILQGIDPSRLAAKGYNFSRPIASNDTSEGRQKNRRVELVIQGNNQK
ncbi:MAG: OmpA family protein [Deltaproteobacteria bacterium]|nr:OmpA family protein [Deltaproteobacteria bacterium]MBW2052431.1 OmpA family protein [Deltaproteobacteria bacterium]MBW2139447.1 OmpA family protein [Deltaproteobacteria bacterium]MBW2324426.1 OmpA family protein [Deltaproteobacteria bacterium]